jgi:hypothetical protein
MQHLKIICDTDGVKCIQRKVYLETVCTMFSKQCKSTNKKVFKKTVILITFTNVLTQTA